MNLDNIIMLLRSDVSITPADRVAAAGELERVQTILEDLSTRIHYSPRDSTGETSTRKVQTLAASALGHIR